MSWVAEISRYALGALLAVAVCFAASGQTVLLPNRNIEGATTPASLNKRLQELAEKATATQARTGTYTNSSAGSETEQKGLAQYSIMLVTVTTQNQAELPLKRVYLARPDGSQQTLRPVLTWRSKFDAGTLRARQLGPYREDGFYLIPTTAFERPGQVLLDFAINRVGFRLLDTLVAAPANLSFKPVEPAPNAQPDRKVLREFLAREFPGFPLPPP